MKRLVHGFALVLGALGAGSCLVYSESDLPADNAGSGGRANNGGASNKAGVGGGGMTNFGGSPATSGNTGTGGANTGGNPPQGGSVDPGGGSGSQGGSTSAGTAGIAGTSAGSGGGAVVYPPELVDDCEDGNQNILRIEKRTGGWYTFGDSTAKAVFTPPASAIVMQPVPASDPGKVPASTKAFRFTATGFQDFGAAAALNFIQPTTQAGMEVKFPYDAATYTGVRFYAKASPPVDIWVRIPVKGTVASGNECALTAAPTERCEDHFRFSVSITAQWAAHDCPFASFAQEGWGHSVGAFTAGSVVSLEFLVPGGSDTELWLDDVQFMK